MSLIGSENSPARRRGANRAGSAEPKATEPSKSSWEIRRHPRLYATPALECRVSLLASAKSWDGTGILKNISLGGVYFTCADPLPLELGQIRNFRLNPATPGDKLRQVSRLSARGLVVRIDRPGPDQAALGIAVKFLSPLQLSPA